jgi:uncharacterized protein (DUF1800 family)
MPVTRRQFLTIGSLAGASALLASCSPVRELVGGQPALAAWPAGSSPAWPALSRLTFGPRADERARVAEIGLDSWIEEQLAPQSLADTDAALRVRRFDTLLMDTSLIFGVREENVRRELQQATLLRAIYSRRQLFEITVDFWSDHFNISTLKGDGAWLKTIDDREVIRPHALGSFRDLLWASMRSPAMLQYLDNQENHRGAPNENYARELMELHTLGVEAGYTQHDVQELARCLTGWTIDRQLFRGQFRFDASVHDTGSKRLLGQIIPAGGERDVERVFELLLAHPALPQFIARKLARRYIADNPPAGLVEAAAATFRRTNGELKAVLATLLHSPEFSAAPPKLKRPLHYVAGALRQLDAETDGGPALLDALAQMGQPLFQWPTPDGFPDTSAAWGGSLLARWRFALGLVAGTIQGTSIDLAALGQASGAGTIEAALDRFGILLLGAPLPPASVAALTHQLGNDLDQEHLQTVVATLLAAPHYQWR